jgi:hypothetical protein
MHAAKDDMTVELVLGELEARGEDWGGTCARHLTLPAGTDFTPLFVGFPAGSASAPTGAT